VADFTYIDTKEGWLYVAAIMDLFSRRIVGLAMSDRMQDNLVMAALQQAFMHRQSSAGLIHHSDRGSQYASKDFKDLLVKYCIIASMSSTGNCYDNAVIESFFILLKLSMFILNAMRHASKLGRVYLNILKYFIIVSEDILL
jgi:transposase InsO family protein